ncbi:MAG: Mut7-C RNAse domain-containing protein [Spirochaetota bacterium]
MATATIRFYEELNRFLPEDAHKEPIAAPLIGNPSVKDVIESHGVPHTEVDLVVVNGESVDFDYRVREGDRIAVYPVFESLDIAAAGRVRPEPLRRTRFVLDVHLGTLARLLRLLGFDARYRNDYDDPDIVEIAAAEGRIVLTRDRGLLMRRRVTHGYWLRSQNPVTQAAEVLRRFDLTDSVSPFSRCPRCNGELEAVSKEAVRDQLPLQTARYYDEFHRCRSCGQVYWQGSHYKSIRSKIRRILDTATGGMDARSDEPMDARSDEPMDAPADEPANEPPNGSPGRSRRD